MPTILQKAEHMYELLLLVQKGRQNAGGGTSGEEVAQAAIWRRYAP